MFIRFILFTVFLLALQNGCMLIGYDSLTDGSAPDSGIEPEDGAGGRSSDGMVSDATSSRDSSLPDAMDAAEADAAEAAIISDGSMDGPQQDAAETGTDADFDDAPTDICQPGELWCDGDKLMKCNASGLAEVEQDCSTLSNTCEVGACKKTENQCETRPRSTGTRWCDGDMLMACDGQGSSEEVKDCSSDSDTCNTGVCNSTTRQCELEPLTSPPSWCEGDVLYTCSNGASVVGQDCLDLSDACNTGVCVAEESRCDAVPVQADTVCLGNGACNDSGTCLCTPDDVWCYDNKLVSCDSYGYISDIEDCGLLDNICNTGVCDTDGKTCKREPVADGRACGQNGTCDIEGNCVINPSSCSSGSNCVLSCSPEIAPCLLICGDADSCTATCQEDSTCAVDCASAATCQVFCEDDATCDVACGSTTLECLIDCTEAESCSNIVCPTDVHCIVSCDPLNSDCGFDGCPEPDDCGSGVYSCNGSCPG